MLTNQNYYTTICVARGIGGMEVIFETNNTNTRDYLYHYNVAIGIRFLVYYLYGSGEGHVQFLPSTLEAVPVTREATHK